MALDKRTYIIVVLMLVVLLPIVILVFRRGFFPIMASLKSFFVSADLYQSAGTGIPGKVLNIFE